MNTGISSTTFNLQYQKFANMNRGEPSPASTPAKATLPQSQATPPTHYRGNDGQTFTSAQKERVNYSNSKEVQQTLNDLDSMIAKRKQELSSITKSGSMSAAHRRKARRTQESVRTCTIS